MSESKAVIQASGIGKQFKLYVNPNYRLLEWLSLGRAVHHRDFWALKEIEIELRRGECLGVIGNNGSGKSTLLKILSGALSPTTGTVTSKGRVFALIELGTGFNLQLSGRKNVAYVGQMLGLDPEYVESRANTIIEFADLGDFIDQPTKFYSSGMFARLAFSMFAFLEPDVLMIDEVLAVGDAAFQQKCLDLLEDRIRSQTTAVMYVSHNLTSVAELCTRVIHLDHGLVHDSGNPETVVHEFLRSNAVGQNRRPKRTGVASPATTAPPQPAILRLQEVDQCPPAGSHLLSVWIETQLGDLLDAPVSCQPFAICWAVLLRDPASAATGFNLQLHDEAGRLIGSINSDQQPADGPPVGGDRIRVYRCPTRAGLPAGTYSVGIIGQDQSAGTVVNEPAACQFRVVGPVSDPTWTLFREPAVTDRPAAPDGTAASFADYR